MKQVHYSKVIAKAWIDPSFKERLLKNPESTLRAEGVEIPEGVKIEVHVNTNQILHLTLPENSGNLTQEQLEAIAGGGDVFTNEAARWVLDNMVCSVKDKDGHGVGLTFP